MVRLGARDLTDDAELIAIYDAQAERLVSFLRGSDRSMGSQRAEELVREAFLTTRASWGEVVAGQSRAREHGPVAYAFRAARRRMVHDLHRQDAPAGNGGQSPPPGIEEDLGRLSMLQRQVVLLAQLHGFAVDQVAQILDVPDQTVTTALAAAPEVDFAAVQRLLRSGPRRRATARRRFVAALQEAGDPPPVDPRWTRLVTAASGRGVERDPAFLHRVLEGLRKM